MGEFGPYAKEWRSPGFSEGFALAGGVGPCVPMRAWPHRVPSACARVRVSWVYPPGFVELLLGAVSPPTPDSAPPAGERSLFTAVWLQCSGAVLHCGLEAGPGVALGTVSELSLCCLARDTPMVAILTGRLKFRNSAGPVGVHSTGTKQRSRMRKSARRTLAEPAHAARLFRGCSCQVVGQGGWASACHTGSHVAGCPYRLWSHGGGPR